MSRQAPLQLVEWGRVNQYGIQLYVKREDLVSAEASGNKFYKLWYALAKARDAGVARILSFGGAYSNHLYALAMVGKRLGMETVGIIRGEAPNKLGATLEDLQRSGMQLEFVSRDTYRQKNEPAYQAELMRRYGPVMIVPEGGAGTDGAKGCIAMGQALAAQMAAVEGADKPYHCVLASGTGTTAAGVLAGSPQRATVHSVSVLKGFDDSAAIMAMAKSLTDCQAEFRHHLDYHYGGYAKFPGPLRQLMAEFELDTGIMLDPVYTAKVAAAIAHLAAIDEMTPGEPVVLLHTGGLQGRRGFGLDY